VPDIDLSDLAAAGVVALLRGYLVTPRDGPWPGVVMIHEALGLTR